MPDAGPLIGAICGVVYQIQSLAPYVLALIVALALTAGMFFKGINMGLLVLAFVAVAVILMFSAFLGALGVDTGAACGGPLTQ